jgi:hypothetical protein
MSQLQNFRKRPEGQSLHSPERELSLLPTGETGGRPEGPTVNRPDRKVGITRLSEMSAEGAALQGMDTPSVAPSALFVTTHPIPASRPGLLTFGPSGLCKGFAIGSYFYFIFIHQSSTTTHYRLSSSIFASSISITGISSRIGYTR